MSLFELSPRRPAWTRETTENLIGGFSILSTIGLVIVGALMVAPLFH